MEEIDNETKENGAISTRSNPPSRSGSRQSLRASTRINTRVGVGTGTDSNNDVKGMTNMGTTRAAGVQQVISLRPELEFEVIKLVLLRENYIKRLKKTLSKSTEVTLAITGLFEVLRETTIEIVETIILWERAQMDYPFVKPFLWNGVNYVQKMGEDLGFMKDYPYLDAWLHFSGDRNPFLIPQEALDEAFLMEPGSLLVFGERPLKELRKKPKSPKKPFVKSPYLTPIVNDTDIIPSNSALSKFQSSQKAARANNNQENDEFKGAEIENDPFQTFISYDTLKRIQKVWRVVNGVYTSSTLEIEKAESITLEESSSLDRPSSIEAVLNQSESLGVDHAGAVNVMGESLSLGNHLSLEEMSLTAGEGLNSSSFNESREVGIQAFTVNEGANTSYFPNVASVTTDLPQHSVFSLESAKHQEKDPNSSNAKMRSSTLVAHIKSSDVLESPSLEKRDDSMVQSTQGSKVWTQHEIHMQRAVHRRGGELFAITAAGSQGRIKAPYRKSRMERMVRDLERLEQQEETIGMEIEDPMSPETYERLVELRENVRMQIGFMRYQYSHFQMISEGEMLALEKQKKLLSIESGMPLEPDEKLSMSLEDRMVIKIQKLLRYKFGKRFRQIMRENMEKAALKIQNFYRFRKTKKWWRPWYYGTRLQKFLAALQRRSFATDDSAVKSLAAAQGHAAKFIQRFVRGALGRYRAKTRKEFFRSINVANEKVSLKNLMPGHIDELCAEIEYFIRDYTRNLPIEILTVLRAIFFMTNDDNPELITVESAGVIEVEKVYAHNLGWNGAKHILRRRGRYLRRVRGLATIVKQPNAAKLSLSPAALAHLTSIEESGMNASAFKEMTQGKHACVQLLEYIKAMKNIYDHQDKFSEYFQPTNPVWFRKIVVQRQHYENAELELRIVSRCISTIQIERDRRKKAGLKLKEVNDALERANEWRILALKDVKTWKKKVANFLEHLDFVEKQHRQSLQATLESREAAMIVAQRDLKYYHDTHMNVDEDDLKELHFILDEKTLNFVEANVKIIAADDKYRRERKARDFESFYSLDVLHDDCDELGTILGEMFILQNDWSQFLLRIGGLQFLKDLNAENQNFFDDAKSRAMYYIQRRRELRKILKEGVDSAMQTVKDETDKVNRALYGKDWDIPTHIEQEAEVKEDLECAKRDADVSQRRRRQADWSVIDPVKVAPVLCLVDTRIPKNLKRLLIEKLKVVNFGVCEYGQREEHAITNMQHLLDENKHILLFVDRGLNYAARSIFVGDLKTILDCLLPPPKVVYVDATMAFRYENWVSSFAFDQPAMVAFNIAYNTQTTMTLAKLRKYASQLRQGLLVNGVRDEEDEVSLATSVLQEQIKKAEEENARIRAEEVEQARLEEERRKAEEELLKQKAPRRTFFSMFGGKGGDSGDESDGKAKKKGTMFGGFGGDSGDESDGKAKKKGTMFGGFGGDSGDESDGKAKKKGTMFGGFGGGLFNVSKETNAAKEDEEERRRIAMVQEQINNNNQEKVFLEMKARDMAIRKAKAEAEMRRLEGIKRAQEEMRAQAERDAIEREMIQKQLASENAKEVEDAMALQRVRQAKDEARIARANRRIDVKLGMTAPISEYTRNMFKRDLDNLVEEIKTALGGDEDDSSVFVFPPHPDIILAAMLACITHKWKAPMISWRARDIMDGALVFVEQLSSPKALFDELSMIPIPRCTPSDAKRFEQAREFEYFWDYIYQIRFCDNPVRYLLLQWILYAVELTEEMAVTGGAGQDSQDSRFYSDLTTLGWDKDICNRNIDAFVGHLLKGSLKNFLLYESGPITIKRIIDTNDLDNYFGPMKQLEALKAESVNVYQYGDDAYICIRAIEDEYERLYFGTMNTEDFIRMIQPNSTEIFEGRVKKVNLKEESWLELIAKWARLKTTENDAVVQPVREKYLILSTYRKLDGHLCRIEVYEGSYLEAEIYVYLSTQKEPLMMKISAELLDNLQRHSINLEEKGRLESLDLGISSSVFVDRVKLFPPKRMLSFLEDTDRVPQNRLVTMTIKTTPPPGRCIGTKCLRKWGLFLLITVYEQFNESDSFSMRIKIYEQNCGGSVEYQISPMERLCIFHDGSSLLDQIIERLTLSYCRHDPDVVALHLSKNYKAPHVEKILTPENTFMESSVGYAEVARPTSNATGVDSENAYIQSASADDLQTYSNLEDSDQNSLSWVVYLSRAAVTDRFASSDVAVVFKEQSSAFEFIVRDSVTFVEKRTLLPFSKAGAYMYKMSQQELDDNLANLNESKAFDILDDLIELVELRTFPKDGSPIVVDSNYKSETMVSDINGQIVLMKDKPKKKHKKMKPRNQTFLEGSLQEDLKNQAPGYENESNGERSSVQETPNVGRRTSSVDSPILPSKMRNLELSDDDASLESIESLPLDASNNELLELGLGAVDEVEPIVLANIISSLPYSDATEVIKKSEEISMVDSSLKETSPKNLDLIKESGISSDVVLFVLLMVQTVEIPEKPTPPKDQPEDYVAPPTPRRQFIYYDAQILLKINGKEQTVESGPGGAADKYPDIPGIEVAPAAFAIPKDEIVSSSIEIEFWSTDFEEFLGSICLKGWELTQFIYETQTEGKIKGSTIPFYKFELDSYINHSIDEVTGDEVQRVVDVIRKSVAGRAVMKTYAPILNDMTVSIPQDALEFTRNMKPMYLMLTVDLSGKAFPDGDGKRKRKRKIGCVVRMNGINVIILNSKLIDKDTGDTRIWCMLTVPAGSTPASCLVEIEVIRNKKKAGAMAINGEELMKALHPNSSPRGLVNSRIDIIAKIEYAEFGESHICRYPSSPLRFQIDLKNLISSLPKPPDAEKFRKRAVHVIWNKEIIRVIDLRQLGEFGTLNTNTTKQINTTNADTLDEKQKRRMYESTLWNDYQSLIVPSGFPLSQCSLEIFVFREDERDIYRKGIDQEAPDPDAWIGDEEYFCRLCKLTFGTQGTLDRHMTSDTHNSAVEQQKALEEKRKNSLKPATIFPMYKCTVVGDKLHNLLRRSSSIVDSTKLDAEEEIRPIPQVTADHDALGAEESHLGNLKDLTNQLEGLDREIEDAKIDVDELDAENTQIEDDHDEEWENDKEVEKSVILKKMNSSFEGPETVDVKLKLLRGWDEQQHFELRRPMHVELQEFLDLENTRRLEQLSFATQSNNKQISAIPANGRIVSSYGMQTDKAYWRYEYPQVNAFQIEPSENKSLNPKNSVSRTENNTSRKDFMDDTQLAVKSVSADEDEQKKEQCDGHVNAENDAEKIHQENSQFFGSNVPVEKAGMRSTKQKSLENKEDTRICWRGKYYPKELVISDEKAREAMMIPRSSKLVVGQTLSNLSALTEVKYLQDEFMLKGVRPDELPIVVKEISSTGPGVVNRIYQIEISTNNGLVLGFANISDKLDLKRVIGEEYSNLCVDGPLNAYGECIKVLDMDKAWNYIVHERLTLTFRGAEKEREEKNESKRRDGLWLLSTSNAISGSSITLERDMSIQADEEEDLLSEESEPDEAMKEAEEKQEILEAQRRERRHQLRIHTKPHIYSGKKFKTLVFLCGSDYEMFTQPQSYFKIPGNHWDYTREEILAIHRSKLENLDILFVFQQNRNPNIDNFRTSGADVLKMIPEKYEVDFSSKYRREQFAKYLAERVGLRYGIMGQHEFYFRDWVLEEVVEKHNIERENERKAFLEKQERDKKELEEEALRKRQRAEREEKIRSLREAKSAERGDKIPGPKIAVDSDDNNSSTSLPSSSSTSQAVYADNNMTLTDKPFESSNINSSSE